MKEFDYNAIPAEKFAFAQAGKKLGDKKLQTKPVGFFRDAWRRFAKNKASIVGMVIIAILLLFSFITPFVSKYGVNDTNGRFTSTLPKFCATASGGFWDGTKIETAGESTYWKYYATGEESGRRAVVKTYETTTSSFSMGGTVYTAKSYKYRLDSYYKIGYSFESLTKDEYIKLQDYQDRTGIQVIYPALISAEMSNSADANYWYKTNLGGSNKGTPVWGDGGEGDFINIYALCDSAWANEDIYTSLRIKGDPGIDEGTSQQRYAYSVNDSNGYKVRVCYYDYYVYQHGFEPVFMFGTDISSKDVMVRVASGTRFSFLLALAVSAINLILGAIYGSVEGYYGGKTDIIMERISDILSGIPSTVVAVLFNLHLAKTVGTVGALIFAFIMTGWISPASTVRIQFYRFKKQEYVLAARTLGARDRRLIVKHIFPNAMGTIITGAALYIPSVIFSETSLSYLGIISLDDPNTGLTGLGTLLSAGQDALVNGTPHIMLFPALVIALLMISFNLFGNGLRDAFNTSLRGSED